MNKYLYSYSFYSRMVAKLDVGFNFRFFSLSTGNQLLCKNRKCPLIKPKKPLNFLVERNFLWDVNRFLPFATFSVFENLFYNLVSGSSFIKNVLLLKEFVDNLLRSIRSVNSKEVQNQMTSFFNSNIKLAMYRDLSNYLVENLLNKYESIFISFISCLSSQSNLLGILHVYKTNLIELEALENEFGNSFFSCNYIELKHSTRNKITRSAIDLTCQSNEKSLVLVRLSITHAKKVISSLSHN